MRYKVLFTNRQPDTTGGSFATSAEFYVLAEAIAAAQGWTTMGNVARAYVWDGEIWREYQ